MNNSSHFNSVNYSYQNITKKEILNLFIISFLVYFTFAMCFCERQVFYDSQAYWTLGDEVIKVEFYHILKLLEVIFFHVLYRF